MTNETVDDQAEQGEVVGWVLEPDGTLTPVVKLNK